MFQSSNVVRVLLFIFIVSCSLGFCLSTGSCVHAQCYGEWTRKCNDPPLSNECDGVCNALGSACGFWMSGMDDWEYHTVRGNQPGGTNSFEPIAPRFCGTIYDCECYLKRDGVTIGCGFSFNGPMTFWNWENIPTGINDEDDCPLPPNPFPKKPAVTEIN